MRVIIIIFFTSIIINSCVFSERNKIKQVKTNTDTFWNSIGVKANDSIFIINDTLYFVIEYVENYHIEESTKNIIYSYWMFLNNDFIQEMSLIQITYSYVDLLDVKTYKYDKESIIKSQDIFKNNSNFEELFLYTINNLKTDEIIGFNQMIKDIKHFVPDRFEFEGTFWELVIEYSKNCCKTNSKAYEDFEWIKYASSNPENPYKNDVINEIIKICSQNCIQK